jgi:hypothetical protein
MQYGSMDEKAPHASGIWIDRDTGSTKLAATFASHRINQFRFYSTKDMDNNKARDEVCDQPTCCSSTLEQKLMQIAFNSDVERWIDC